MKPDVNFEESPLCKEKAEVTDDVETCRAWMDSMWSDSRGGPGLMLVTWNCSRIHGQVLSPVFRANGSSGCCRSAGKRHLERSDCAA